MILFSPPYTMQKIRSVISPTRNSFFSILFFMHLIFWVGGTAYAQSNNFQNYMKQAILQIKKGQPEQAIKTASIMMGEVPELLKAGNTEAVIRLYKVQIEAYRMTDHDEMANQKMNELKTLITRRGVSEENFNASYKNLLLQ